MCHLVMSRKHMYFPHHFPLSPPTTYTHTRTHAHTNQFIAWTQKLTIQLTLFFSYKLKLAVIYGTALCRRSSMEGAESISLQYRAIPTGVS